MRRITYHAQTTLDGRIADADGGFWEPFPWGETEQAYVNDLFRTADTWVLGRHMYDAIVPWWSAVASGNLPDDAGDLGPASRDFADIFTGLRIVVVSRTLDDDGTRTVLRGDPVAALRELKAGDGGDIVFSCGPRLLAPIAAAPGLVDEYLFAVHPMVLSSGPRVFDEVRADLPLRLVGAEVFEGGAVVLRYEPQPPADADLA
jgi:dihydrofolate reductase